MIKNYVRFALRKLKRSGFPVVLNIIGLSIGMAASVLIFHFVKFEKSYDKFHSKYDAIYRLTYHRASESGESVHFASCAPPAGIRIRELFPEVDELTRFLRYKATLSNGDIHHFEENIYFADSAFLSLFDFIKKEEVPARSLRDQGTMLISRSSARKYFGEEDPVGKSLALDGNLIFMITGQFDEIPLNSHLQFDFLLSWPDIKTIYGIDFEEAWGHTGVYTYLTFQEGADLANFNYKVGQLIEKENGEMLKYYRLTMDFPLQRLQDIHLDSHLMQEHLENGDRNRVSFLIIVALLILILAWTNYMILATAESTSRIYEIGLRKINGAGRKNIILQVITEMVFLQTIALMGALMIIYLVHPFFRSLADYYVDHHIFHDHYIFSWLFLMYISGIIFSGIYPILVISAIKPMLSLKGKQSATRANTLSGKILVTVQNFISLSLLIYTLVITLQYLHIKNSDTGITTENVIAIKSPRVRSDSYSKTLNTFIEILQKESSINIVSSVSEVPGRQLYWDAGGIFRVGSDQSKNYQIIGTDYNYLTLFNIELLAGRNFSPDFPTDSFAILLNKKATEWMGFLSIEAALGSEVDYWGNIFHIIGVVEDFHQQTVKYEAEPTIIRFMPEGPRSRGNIVIRSSERLSGNKLEEIERLYDDLFPGNPFDYYYIDKYYNQQFEKELLLSRVFWIFAAITIIINILGIIGLTAYTVNQQKKEISIRKVLGGSASGIIQLFLNKLLLLILIAFLLCMPLTWVLAEKWLITYSRHINISLLHFMVPLALTTAYSMFTVFIMVYKESQSDPVKNLRYE